MMYALLERAIELAFANVKEGGQPFGAVLAKGDEVIAEGVNELHKTFDISGHAELVAIRKAQAKMQTHDLSGYTMYASGEPCPMCLSAMYFSGIQKVYYCATIDDAEKAGLGKSKMIYRELTVPKEQRTMKMIHVPNDRPERDVMRFCKKYDSC